MARENGKVLARARYEVAAGYGEARYYAGVARNVLGRTFESDVGKLSLMTREPSGAVSVIVPWNAPMTLLLRSVAPALAAGCVVVIKPAPQTPLTNAAVMACFHDAPSLPAGIINSVNEYGTEVGTQLSSHPEINVISFTGSSRTGKGSPFGNQTQARHSRRLSPAFTRGRVAITAAEVWMPSEDHRLFKGAIPETILEDAPFIDPFLRLFENFL